MRNAFKNISIYLLIVVGIMLLLNVWGKEPEKVQDMNVTELVTHLNNGEVKSLRMEGRTVLGKLNDGDKTQFKVFIPEEMKYTFYQDYIKDYVEGNKLVDGKKLDYSGEPEPDTPWLVSILPTILIIIVIVVIWFSFMQQSQGGSGGKMMSFGKSKAKKYEDKEMSKITFEKVAGLKEEKEELGEIVDFLKDPKKYIQIGARIPKGVLLVGPPGTGKTYLSKAVAGEAKVPFFTISGSDFVEMFVGVGASRVRDLFEEAKKNSPSIIFIDEIDAVGRKRGAGLGGGHDEREQTLNQLLVEMDGFDNNEGVIVMAATNRADILDPAILRPGRFDRKIYVGLPDVKGRKEMLEVHTKNKPLAEDVELEEIAKNTGGFSPADLENLTNEAAILSARNGLDKINMDTINEAVLKVQMGPEKKSRVVVEKERKITAYHEAGHAITSRLIDTEDPVSLITIVPRGMAGGFTAYTPKEDRSYRTKKQMEGSLVSLLGGRIAEDLVLGDISTGASNDLERATKIARDMVTVYGMSKKLGPLTYGDESGEVFVGRDIGKSRNYSEDVAGEIDKEVRRIIDEAYEKSETILKENLDILHRLAERLLDVETVTGEEFEKIFQGEDIEVENIEDTNKDSKEVEGKEEEN